MAGMNDNAVLTAGSGWVFLAPANTLSPTDLMISPLSGGFDPADLPIAWVPVGHTSRDDLPEFGSDGGDSEVRGSWQNSALRQTITEVSVDYVTLNLLQFDNDTLALYYGSSNPLVNGERRFRVKSSASGTVEKALLVVIVDGDASVGFYAPKASFKREDAISLATDDFGALPVRATFLQGYSGTDTTDNRLLFDWIGGEIQATDETP
jgi:hypothetical protein